MVEDDRKSGWFGRELDDFLIAQAQRAKPELTEEPDNECGCPVCFDADGTNGETWSADRQDLEQAIGAVRYELLRATLKHPPIASAHEGYAILAEELAELLERSAGGACRAAMRKECDQLAAMCLRFRRDVLTDESKNRPGEQPGQSSDVSTRSQLVRAMAQEPQPGKPRRRSRRIKAALGLAARLSHPPLLAEHEAPNPQRLAGQGDHRVLTRSGDCGASGREPTSQSPPGARPACW